MSKMPDKRKPPSSTTGSSPYAKRTRPSYVEGDDDADNHVRTTKSTTYEGPRNDPVYGQKSAFPGLDDSIGDELFYGPAEDGIEYLRMVRSEANSLPSFFIATKPSETSTSTVVESSDQQQRQRRPDGNQTQKHQENVNEKGIYSDGVYIGPPVTNSTGIQPTKARNPKEQDQDPDPSTSAQATYYNLLRHRFLLLRSTLRCAPPASAIAALDDSHPISLPRGSRPARKEWRRLLLSVDPQMVQLACMDMDSVFGVLEIMARVMSENLRSGDPVKVRRIGAWAWGLLGKCREVGQLGTEEVGDIRDLGKRAVKILGRLREDEDRDRLMSTALDKEESDQEQELVQEDDDRDGNGDGDDHAHEDDYVPELGDDNANATVSGILDHDMPDAEPEPGPTPSLVELDAAKARLQARLQPSDSSEQQRQQQPTEATNIRDNQNNQGLESELELRLNGDAIDVAKQTRAMLDMIITIVGEYYGQRDLLAAREIWDEDFKL